jgi:hypothetical protein
LGRINALAFTAGFAAFFAPGGVGVREAALVALLGGIVSGTGARLAIAASSRLWLVLTEIVGGRWSSPWAGVGRRGSASHPVCAGSRQQRVVSSNDPRMSASEGTAKTRYATVRRGTQ